MTALSLSWDNVETRSSSGTRTTPKRSQTQSERSTTCAPRDFWHSRLRMTAAKANKSMNSIRTKDLMSLVWDLFGKNIVPVAVYDGIPSLSFVIVGVKNKATRRGIVLVPTNWVEITHEDPIGQAGALVFVGSQARDYYNGKLYGSEDSKETKDRALAYEAEYLLTALKESKFELKQYQKDILKQFPQGVNTPEAQRLLYTSRKFSLEADA